VCLVLDFNIKMNQFPILQPTGFAPTHSTATLPTVAVAHRAGAIPPTAEVPAFFNHPIMQKFGALDHTNFESYATWWTPTAAPLMRLGLDTKEERWGLFARDEMALLVGAAIYTVTKKSSFQLLQHLNIFKGQATKQEFFSYVMGHTLALLHGGFTAIMFSRWADKMFVHPDNPSMPIDQRIQTSIENSKPVRFLKKTVVQLQSITSAKKHPKPVNPLSYKHSIKSVSVQPITAKPRSGTATTVITTETPTFFQTLQKHFNENLGVDSWARAQKLSNYFIAVPVLPALRWQNYITKEQEQKVGKEEAHRKRTELAVRDASTMFGGNLLYLTTWVVGLSVLEHKLPQLSLNYRQNVASVFGDLAKNLNAGIFAVLLSKWVTAKKMQPTGNSTTITPHQSTKQQEETVAKTHHSHEMIGIGTKNKRHFHA
jgi:hypothetical protein